MESKNSKKNAPQKKGKQKGKKGPNRIAALAKLAREEADEEQKLKEQEELEAKLKAEEEERLRLEEEKRKKEEAERIKEEKRLAKEEAKKAGLYMTKSQQKAHQKNENKLKQMQEQGLIQVQQEFRPMGLPSGKKKKKQEQAVEVIPEPQLDIPEEEKPDQQSDEDLDDWENMLEEEDKQAEEDEVEEEEESEDEDDDTDNPYNSPVLCILGHVDTGKTKLLDKIRRTNVQVGEAGGITQQIGATMFPAEAMNSLTCKLTNMTVDIKIPGLLIIDTPGHESFTNLRSRGSSLCNLGILVVDIMHGLENQTIESLEMLLNRRIPFLVALNKIDQLYKWVPQKDAPFLASFETQHEDTRGYFRDRASSVCLQFAERGLNAALYFENPDPDDYISLVPTSAITGEGLPDLLGNLVLRAQGKMLKSLMHRPELQATVMEVKTIEGHGTTIDVILANGHLRSSDKIVVAGMNGPIVTSIRALLTPHPLREMRVKGDYIHHKKLRASIGVKISAPNLEQAMAGSPLFVAHSEDMIDDLMAEVNRDVSGVFKYISKKGAGVCVHASTIGSLEALLEFLKTSKIPVGGIGIGTIHKKDILKAMTQLENSQKKEFATILAFDVKVSPEAQEYADNNGIRIFTADIIYHLFDSYTKYLETLRAENKKADGMGKEAIFPCILKIVGVIRTSGPIILGVQIVGGVLKPNTPLCVPERSNLIIGGVESIQINNKPVQKAEVGQEVAIKIKPLNSEQSHYAVGRHFEEKDQVASWITRISIDALKDFFRDEMTNDYWKIVKVLKAQYGIP